MYVLRLIVAMVVSRPEYVLDGWITDVVTFDGSEIIVLERLMVEAMLSIIVLDMSIRAVVAGGEVPLGAPVVSGVTGAFSHLSPV